MSRVPALPMDATVKNATLAGLWSTYENDWGFVANSLLTLAWKPALIPPLAELSRLILQQAGETSVELRWMVGHIVSRAAGCNYCSAHTGHNALTVAGLSEKKLSELWSFEYSDEFSPAERSALRVALAAGVTPNAVTDEMMTELRAHFSDEGVVEIVAVIAWFGFFNRWNDTMSTELETAPLGFARKHLVDES